MTTKRDITTVIGATIGLLLSLWLGYITLVSLAHLVPESEPHAAVIRIAVCFAAFWMLAGLGAMLTIGLVILFGWLGHSVGNMFYTRSR